jgi:heat shock protein HtpX
MKFLQIGKRVFLFLLVNLLVMVTIGLLIQAFGLTTRFRPGQTQALMVFCLIYGMGGAFLSLALSRVMAKWFMGVKVIDPHTSDPQMRELVETVHEFARRAGLSKMPEVGIYGSAEVNAFATGPSQSRSLVAVSMGLLNHMNRNELRGVLAHEMAHIANGDMVTMTLIQGVVNAFVEFLARVLAFVASQAMRGNRDDRGGSFVEYLLIHLFRIAFSILGAIVVCWFSRTREFRADAGGMLMAGKEPMIGALQALQRLHGPPVAEAGSSAFQTMKISGKPSRFLGLWASHPPLEDRIAFLQRLGNR